MRSEVVYTHFSCNQNCVYCHVRRPGDERPFIATAAVRARIDEAIGRGGREVVLSGGEPGMRGDLEALVMHARTHGAEAVTLETNATLVDEPRARALAAAGLTLARVNLTGFGDALDGVTRDPGGFARTLAGLRALLAASVPVEIAVVVVRSTRALLPGLPEKLAA